MHLGLRGIDWEQGHLEGLLTSQITALPWCFPPSRVSFFFVKFIRVTQANKIIEV